MGSVVNMSGAVDFTAAVVGCSYTRGKSIVLCHACGKPGEMRGRRCVHAGRVRGGRFQPTRYCVPGQHVEVGSLVERPNLDVLEVTSIEGEHVHLTSLGSGRETRVKLRSVQLRGEYDVLSMGDLDRAREEHKRSPHASWNRRSS